MVGAQLGLQDGLGALVGVVGGVQVSKGAQHSAEVVENACGVGVVGAEPGLEDRKGALVVGPGGGQLAIAAQRVADIVQAAGHVGWSGPSRVSRMARARSNS